MNNRNKMIIIILVLLIVIASLIAYKKIIKKDNVVDIQTSVNDNLGFDYKVIRETNNLVKNENYLISPLSMGFALKLLDEGADSKTKEEIDKLLNNYKLPNIMNVKDRIGIANLLFIKNQYKNDISNEYINALKEKYSSDLIFDEFITPDKANEWISDKTYGMIKNAIDSLSEDFVLGVANTIAIDVEWKNKFECQNTNSKEFTKVDNTKMQVAMMHGENDVYYIENENAKGIIKDYAIYDTKTNSKVFNENENTVALEYIAILPNKDVSEYLKTFDDKELNNLLKTQKRSDSNTDIYYSLPKYTYDYTYDDFQKMLNNLGMNEAFNRDNANFKKMLNSNSLLQLFVSKSIHKTHIELSENGTKAAAVTAFLLEKNSAFIGEKNTIRIEFNKPFIYIIKEKNSDNIWFFGTVYEPIKWEDNKDSCKN